jgi:hypothetical protein
MFLIHISNNVVWVQPDLHFLMQFFVLCRQPYFFFPIMAEKELSKQEFLKIICSLLSVQRSIRRVAQVSTLLITIVYKYKLY